MKEGKRMALSQAAQVDASRFETALHVVANVFDSTLEGIMVADVSGTIIAVNSVFTTVTGYLVEEAIGCKTSLLNSGVHGLEFYVEMWASIYEKGCWQGEIYNRRKNGEIYPEWLKITAIRNAAGTITHYAGVFSDLTAQKRHEELIKRQVTHDPLTGLPNRQQMQQYLQALVQQEAEQPQPFALLFLDLDRFKGINDSFGLLVGDGLLRLVAERLESCLTADEQLARMGGDEFAIVLTGISGEKRVSQRVQQIAEAFEQVFHYAGHEFIITASMGISLYPFDAQDTEALMTYADTALYRAREHGGNQQQFYAPEWQRRAVRLQTLEQSLHRALERNEFVIHYQPKFDTSCETLCGMEALIRWEHPELGLLSPGEFIPLAEELGLIESIGEWVLRSSCQQTKAWHDQGLPKVRVAVNLSTRQFQQKKLVATIARILEETGIEPQYLELEVTESMAMAQANQAIFMLQELKKVGVTLSLDDFGTGYSSLSYLTRFPIDVLKIDRSFIQDLFKSTDNAAIVHAIISLAHSLKMNVIAEGVETEKQWHFLQHHRCDEVQGFLFGKPLPAAEFEQLLYGVRAKWTEVV